MTLTLSQLTDVETRRALTPQAHPAHGYNFWPPTSSHGIELESAPIPNHPRLALLVPALHFSSDREFLLSVCHGRYRTWTARLPAADCRTSSTR